MCRDTVRKAKPQVKGKFVRDVKNYKKEFFRYYDGLDHDKYHACTHPNGREQYQNNDKAHGLRLEKFND